MHRYFPLSLLVLLLGLLCLTGTHPPAKRYSFPIDRYRDLSGTFGELRGNHFHGGMDIKTYGNRGIPVRAIADGYVYRIRTGPYGYGNGLYLKLEDGKVAVYGHLQRFAPEITAYHHRRQEEAEETAYNSYLPPSALPVKRGDLIGYSGNSGSSFGPHLHFEIRDEQERPLNPLAYYKIEVPDSRPPVLQQVAFQPIGPQGRIEGVWEKKVLRPRGGDGSYRLSQPVRLRGPVGLEYEAYDLLDGAGNPCGINRARLYLDGELIYQLKLDNFGFDETRAINLHFDYAHYQRTRDRLQRAYVAEGNPLRFYPLDQQGLIDLEDDEVHQLRLELWDLHDNGSVFTAEVQRDTAYAPLAAELRPQAQPEIRYELMPQLLKLAVQGPPPYLAELGLQARNQAGQVMRLSPAYADAAANELVFLVPLDRYNYPVAVQDDSGQVDLRLPLQDEVFPHRHNLIELNRCQAFFPYRATFRPLHLLLWQEPGRKGMHSDIYHIGQETEPLWRGYVVGITPDSVVPGLCVARWDGGEWDYADSRLGPQGNVMANVSSFGAYCLMADTTPPTVRNISFADGSRVSRNSQLVLRVRDDFSGLDHGAVVGHIDGQWVPFAYDFKRRTLTGDLSWETWTPGEKTLTLRVPDRVGNARELSYRLRF